MYRNPRISFQYNGQDSPISGKLVNKTLPSTKNATEKVNKYIEWGAGPRASQYLIIGAKTSCIFNGKFSPDIEDVQKVVLPVLCHRLVKNYKAEGISVEEIIKDLL